MRYVCPWRLVSSSSPRASWREQPQRSTLPRTFVGPGTLVITVNPEYEIASPTAKFRSPADEDGWMPAGGRPRRYRAPALHGDGELIQFAFSGVDWRTIRTIAEYLRVETT